MLTIGQHGILGADGLRATGRPGVEKYDDAANAFRDDFEQQLTITDRERGQIERDPHLSPAGRMARLAELAEKSRAPILAIEGRRSQGARQDSARAVNALPGFGEAGDPATRALQQIGEREIRDDLKARLAASPRSLELLADGTEINAAESAALRLAREGDAATVRAVLRSPSTFRTVVRPDIAQVILREYRAAVAPQIMQAFEAAEAALAFFRTQAATALRHVSGRGFDDELSDAARGKKA